MEEKKPNYTPEEVRKRLAELCREHRFYVSIPGNCYECGYAILMHHAQDIMERGEYGITGCPNCGRTYCD